MIIMFDWWKNKNATPGTADNVVPFPTDRNLPDPKLVPPMPEVNAPAVDDSKIFYRFGITDRQRIAFSMGGMEITMNKSGCKNMIEQLTFFMNQLDDEVDE